MMIDHNKYSSSIKVIKMIPILKKGIIIILSKIGNEGNVR
jgi:hypothetical protein